MDFRFKASLRDIRISDSVNPKSKFTNLKFSLMVRDKLPQKIGAKFQSIYRLLYNKYWVDELYSKTIVQPVLKASDKIILGFFDAKIIEGVVNGLPHLIGAFSERLRKVQTGIFSFYAAPLLG